MKVLLLTLLELSIPVVKLFCTAATLYAIYLVSKSLLMLAA